MQNCFRHSKLELRGPRSGLTMNPRSSAWGALCIVVLAGAETAGERGRWASRGRFSGVSRRGAPPSGKC
eukprot:11002474-Alexandrium_andersonii.AAC.1